VIFAVLKRCLNEEWDCWEREIRQSTSKENFLTVYGCTHLCTLTPNIICTTFHKTRIILFNDNVIPKEAMAPAKETSCEGHLPLVDTNIQKLANALQKWLLHNETSEDDGSNKSVI
jgi:hypothetical protein